MPLVDQSSQQEKRWRHGTTCQAHIDQLLEDATVSMSAVVVRVQGRPCPLKPIEREALSRQLAGVIADCETIRIWLVAGAPL